MWFLYPLLLLFSFSALCLSPSSKYLSYLKQEEKEEAFQKIQEDNLRKYLKKQEKAREEQKSIQKRNQFLELRHERQQKEFQKKRKQAFLKYKKQYAHYKQKRRTVLERQLKELQKIRKTKKALPSEKILFEL